MALTRPRLGQINTTVSNFTDPIVVFNAGSTQANVDQGILFNRANGLVSNVALFFSESANSFVLGFTANSGQTNSNIQLSGNANLQVKDVRASKIYTAEGLYWAGNGAVYGYQDDVLRANVGAYQIYANANASTQSLSIDSINANVGSYQIYANANAASQQTQIDNLNTQAYANANVAAYLTTYSGDIGGTLTTASQPNITTLGNLTSFGASFGSTVAQGNLTVVGNLTVQGNTLTIGSNNLTVVDSIIDLHTFANLDPLISDDGRDIGLRFHYYKGADTHAFLGWENNVETLVYLQNSNETNSNITGTFGNVHFGSLLLSNTAVASSTTTGALQVRGGVGIDGSLFILNTGDVSANIGAYQTYANANVVAIQANLGAFQIFSNTNAATQATSINSIDANVGAYQTYANANAATQATSINSIDANVGAYQTYANANVVAIQANLGAYQIYANANIGTLFLGNASTNANLGAYQSYANIYLKTAATFTVTNTGAGAYVINSESNPALYLIRGQKYNFSLNAAGHPFWIKTAPSTGTGNQYNTGVENNGAAVGLITFDVPLTAPDILYYNCQIHSVMAGELHIVNFSEIDANIGTLYLGNIATNANIGAYQTFANASIVSLYTNANTNTAAYLSTYTGNVQAGNLLITGNIRADSNVFANIFYVSNSIRWAGNGAVFASGGGGGGGGITYTASNTAPISPSIGDQWYYVADDILFEYINDGDSNQWVDVNGLGQLATSNITLIGNATLQGNIIVQNNNLYSIGAASGYLSNIFSNTVTANTITLNGTISGNVVGNITGNVYGNIINSTGTINVTGDLIPSANVTYSLGSTSRRWKDLWIASNTIYIGSENLTVSSTGTWTFSSNGSNVQLSASNTTFSGNITTSGSILPTANVTQNIGASNLWWGTFYGISTQAQYADLAENYVADANYAPGTVLVFGGACEVTVSTSSHDTRIAGVVSENPAYLMNAAKGNVSVALTGRVPCQVKGPVDKGTVLVSSSIAGVAQMLNTAQYQPGCVIGKSLETIEDNMIKTIEIAVGRF